MASDRIDRWVAYLGPIPFPEGTSSARRVVGVARCIVQAGYEVRVAAGYLSASEPATLNPHGVDARISYQGTGEWASRCGMVAKAMRLFVSGGAASVDWLDRQPTAPAAVIVYGTVLAQWRRLLNWCQAKRVPLIADVVDWYNLKQMPGGLPNYLANEYTLRRQVSKADGLIGISSFLCDYYGGLGLRTIRIPPVVDVRDFTPGAPCRESGVPMNLVYAGVPENKDLLGNVFGGMVRFDPEGRRCQLHLVGPSEEQVRQLWPNYPAKAVRIYGRCSYSRTLEIVRGADFSVLLRPDERYAHAGFSTKAVESFASGTPVIGNLTSDLGQYLCDAANAWVCPRPDAHSFAASLERALDARERWPAMRGAARQTAEKSFDYRPYAPSMRQFLDAAAADKSNRKTR